MNLYRAFLFFISLNPLFEHISSFIVKCASHRIAIKSLRIDPLVSLCRRKALPRVEIEYCPGCRWLLRSSWLAQELLTTFESTIGEVALIPNREKTGTFIIRVNDTVIWDRRSPDTPGFPEISTLKQSVRDLIDPSMILGHSDRKNKNV